MEDVIVREATAADAPFLLSLARDAYREVLARQFGGWDDSIHGVRFAERSRAFLVGSSNCTVNRWRPSPRLFAVITSG